MRFLISVGQELSARPLINFSALVIAKPNGSSRSVELSVPIRALLFTAFRLPATLLRQQPERFCAGARPSSHFLHVTPGDEPLIETGSMCPDSRGSRAPAFSRRLS